MGQAEAVVPRGSLVGGGGVEQPLSRPVAARLAKGGGASGPSDGVASEGFVRLVDAAMLPVDSRF